MSRVEDRCRLNKEYHESAIGGHKGMTEMYDKLAHEYYWRAMQADVRQYIQGCPDCQTQKLVRIKTKLPMIISKAIDFVGPKEPTSVGNQYILTIQDNFSKYCVLVPVRQTTAEEVTRALTEKLICYFGSLVTLISDQGPHFNNKFSTTAYHSQSNGDIERMHHVLNEYLKFYQKNLRTGIAYCRWPSTYIIPQCTKDQVIHRTR